MSQKNSLFNLSLNRKIFSPPNSHEERPNRIRWINDDDIVIADSQLPHIQTPDKLLNTNGSLEVINVQLNDTGNYICEVTVGYRVSKQEHSIEVQGNKTNQI